MKVVYRLEKNEFVENDAVWKRNKKKNDFICVLPEEPIIIEHEQSVATKWEILRETLQKHVDEMKDLDYYAYVYAEHLYASDILNIMKRIDENDDL